MPFLLFKLISQSYFQINRDAIFQLSKYHTDTHSPLDSVPQLYIIILQSIRRIHPSISDILSPDALSLCSIQMYQANVEYQIFPNLKRTSIIPDMQVSICKISDESMQPSLRSESEHIQILSSKSRKRNKNNGHKTAIIKLLRKIREGKYHFQHVAIML